MTHWPEWTIPETSNAYRDASMMSMRRMIKGKSPEEIREMRREDLDRPVSIQDYEEAIIRQPAHMFVHR